MYMAGRKSWIGKKPLKVRWLGSMNCIAGYPAAVVLMVLGRVVASLIRTTSDRRARGKACYIECSTFLARDELPRMIFRRCRHRYREPWLLTTIFRLLLRIRSIFGVSILMAFCGSCFGVITTYKREWGSIVMAYIIYGWEHFIICFRGLHTRPHLFDIFSACCIYSSRTGRLWTLFREGARREMIKMGFGGLMGITFSLTCFFFFRIPRFCCWDGKGLVGFRTGVSVCVVVCV